ncbi:amino acid adenylation domain-containing protein [Allocatelliglobosispora scoriae]|uniref:Amino acid adenylation domain-containing protein n=1 Tax=Allocatelliglobosispora scoriae TaxID=643052 RepID=A0A841BES9_9ACTN|nr:AMP-binding protein [Allocatelliglobosispora scoriae]MBB5867587.1 amino acid adenylation domain-containing protein [Allocatelliglobosispora scoriae]
MSPDRLTVVVNGEDQYSLWPADRDRPDGWSSTGAEGGLDECLAYVAEHWTDLRPRSLRSPRATAAAPVDETAAAVDPATARALGPRVAIDEQPVQVLVERACTADPDRIAVRCGDDTVTAGELISRVREWSRVLRGHGAAAETPVAVLLPRSVDAVTAILAVLHSGSAYLPMSFLEPPDRLARILADAGEPVVIASATTAGLLPGYGGTVLDIAHPPAPESDADDGDPDCGIDNLAFIMYTSGTSGTPKGVLGTHRQLVNYVRWCAAEFPFTDKERAVLHAPLHFVGSVMTLFTALIAGWELVVAPEPVPFDALIELTAQAPCGFLKLTPSHVRAMTALGGVDDIARQVMIGSEPLYLTPEFDRWISASPASGFGNHYGMSETVGATWWWIGADRTVGERLPVGAPIRNAEVYVLGPDGQPLGFGEAGEIHLGGSVIGRGYHGQPVLTAQRWVPHPWGPPGARLLRTGDLGSMRPDGVLDVLGRADRQVKIRGQRVEPPAVEDALRRCPGIAEAVVVAEPDGHEVQLVAYLRPEGEDLPTEAELRRHAASLLPEASIPARMLYLAAYPLTPNGKVDTRRLAQAQTIRPALTTAFTEPTGPVEIAVAAVVADVLKTDRLGALDDFFELGGDSMQVVEVVTRLDEELGLPAAISDVFDHPTVRALAAALAGRGPGRAAAPAAGQRPPRTSSTPVAPAPPIGTDTGGVRAPFAAADSGDAPLTWGQQAMWRPLQWFGDASADFNIKRVLRLGRPVPIADAVTAWSELVGRHQVLRTLVTDDGTGPRQRVQASGDHRLELRDGDPDEAAAALAAAPFDLTSQWPVRVALITADGQADAFAVAASHAVLDGWALELLLGECRDLLESDQALPPVGWRPLDQAAYEQSPAGQRRAEQALEFWRAQLPAAPQRLFAGPDLDGGDLPIVRWRLESTAIPAAAAALAQRTGTSSSTVLLAATGLVLGAASGRDDVVLKLIAGNRYTPRQKELAAQAAQDGIYVFRPGGGDVLAAISRCYRDSTESYFHAAYPPDDLAALLTAEAADRDLSAFFNDARMGRDWEPTLPAEPTRADLDRLRAATTVAQVAALAKHDMTFYLQMPYLADGCALQLLADTRRISPAACLRALRGIETLLCEAVLRDVAVSEVGELLELP